MASKVDKDREPPIADLRAAIKTGIRASVGSGRPEAVLREHVQPVLSRLLAARGARSSSRDEVRLRVPDMSQASMLDAPLDSEGRADAIYNRFVIEFEPPGSLRRSVMHSATRHAVNQVQQYLRGTADETGLPLDRLAGCAFDGSLIVYVTWERGTWSIARPVDANPHALGALLDTLESLASGRGLTADNLHEDFGRASNAAGRVVRALSETLHGKSASSRAMTLFDEWRVNLGNASGPFSPSDEVEWHDLCGDLGIDSSRGSPDFILFSLHTYFALVAKLISVVILEGTTGKPLFANLKKQTDVRVALEELEEGTVTSSVGALNVIEPGLFSWYVREGGADLTAGLGQMLELASEYSAEIIEVSPLIARDILKDLYQRLLPRSIRHRLGEYYTPDWLAQRVVNQVTGSPDRLDSATRVLDPACGSGTFLVEVISRMVQNVEDTESDRVLSKILENVVGFDLSPLAVQAARVNYLLALAPLLPHRSEPISIPVYLADAVAFPRAGGLLEGDVRVFDSSEGEWRVPTTLADAQYLDTLGSLFQEALANAHDREWVMREAEARIPIDLERDPLVFQRIDELYRKLHALHAADRDGIWWQLVRNAFAPSLEPRFDYIVGNPPWVSWQTLPEAYRRRNDALWLGYALRPDSSTGRRQSSSNVQLDVSMLFTACCVDRYLKPKGTLGFVITSTVFKSELAGRGFRRRRLSPERTYQFLHIDDMTDLQVFSDATNQASVLIAKLGEGTSGRVAVTKWAGTERRTIPPDKDLSAVQAMTTRRHLHGEPADPADPASPLLVMPRAGLISSIPARRESHYLKEIREGINTRGANGIFFLEVLDVAGDKLRVRNVPSAGRNQHLRIREAIIEREATRNLLRGSDVSREGANPSGAVLFFHDAAHLSRPFSPAEASDRFPAAFAFAAEFKETLAGRRRFRGFDPAGDDWLGLYSVTKAALAQHKVVVREIATGMVATAVHGADIVPDHKLYVIPCKTASEAERLAWILNAPVVDYLLRCFSISTSITGSFLRYIGVVDLNELSPEMEGDALVAAALGLTPSEYRNLEAVARSEP